MGEHDKHRQRLRERYIANGLKGFADHEALELLLTYAIPRVNTNDTAHRLLKHFGSLTNVFAADTAELCQVEGIGQVSAVMLRLIDDLMQRLQIQSFEKGNHIYIDSPQAAARFVSVLLRNERSAEAVYIVCLDKNNRVLFTDCIAKGALTEVPLYPRTIVQIALRYNAKSIILAHNHPSGDPTPSRSDLNYTAVVKETLEHMDISLYDHMIVGQNAVYSFSGSFVIRLSAAIETVDSPQKRARSSEPLMRAAETSQPNMDGRDENP